MNNNPSKEQEIRDAGPWETICGLNTEIGEKQTEIESLRSQLENRDQYISYLLDTIQKTEQGRDFYREDRNRCERLERTAFEKLQQAEQEREELYTANQRLSHDLDDMPEIINMQADEIKSLREQLEVLEQTNTAMREALELLVDDYDRRIRSAQEIIMDQSSSYDQRHRVCIKEGEYRSIKAELERILSRYTEGTETP